MVKNKSNITCDPFTDIGPQIIEHRPNSKTDTSADNRAESPILSLTEHYVMTHTINQWVGPKYLMYSTKGTCLRSFIIHDWSHVLETALTVLSDAGFSKVRLAQYFK